MKYIKELTKEQKKMMPVWAEKWIKIGLKTGKTDWKTFDKYMPICFKKAGLEYPKRVVRVSSPLVGALAASIAGKILNSNAVNGAVGDAVVGAVNGAVGGAVDDAVGGAVDNAVHGAVHDAVRGAVNDAVVGAVDNAVHDAVRDAVDDAVGGAVHNAVHGAVHNAVRDAVDGAVSDAKLKWHYWFGGQFWVGYGYWFWGGPAFVSFFTKVCKLELSKDIMERAEAYQKVCQSVNYIWPNKDFVMVCARPQKINRDERGRLHSLTEKSIEYPDGWGLYHINGVRFDENLWKKVVNKELSGQEIMKIQDMEQRMIALKYYGAENLLKDFNTKQIDKSERGNELYGINGLIPDREVKLLKYSCPSTERVYVKFVPFEIKGADEANAWCFQITTEEYQYLKLEA